MNFAGVGHPDIHVVRNEVGKTKYPLVARHEIAGVVAGVGWKVSKYAVDDRVGVGCMVDSCRERSGCRAGLRQCCLRGAISTHGVWARMASGRRVATAAGSSSMRITCCASLMRSPWTLLRRCCARGSLSSRHCGIGTRDRASGLQSSAWAGIQPEIELIELDHINQAYERVLASDVRYRFVIDTSSLE